MIWRSKDFLKPWSKLDFEKILSSPVKVTKPTTEKTVAGKREEEGESERASMNSGLVGRSGPRQYKGGTIY